MDDNKQDYQKHSEREGIDLIHLTDDLYLDSDEHNYILFRWDGKFRKEGKNIKKQDITYHGTLTDVLSHIKKRLTLNAIHQSTNFNELLKYMEIIADSILQAEHRLSKF
mgnify:CR=1 FL=1